MSPLSTSGDQNTGVSASASVLPNEYSELISLKMTGLISLLSKESELAILQYKTKSLI